MEPKQAVLESKIDYVKMEINGKLELVCAHKYGYYEQLITNQFYSLKQPALFLCRSKHFDCSMCFLKVFEIT
jgi:hypothetical protein